MSPFCNIGMPPSITFYCWGVGANQIEVPKMAIGKHEITPLVNKLEEKQSRNKGEENQTVLLRGEWLIVISC